MDEFKFRFGLAKQHRKNTIEDAAREVYKYAYNGRETEWDLKATASSEPEEIFTDVPATLAEDFHGELFSTMTPENSPWASFEAGSAVDEDKAAEVEKQIKEYEKLIARAVRRSNYYDEGPSAFKDAVVGTVAMWSERPTLNGPAVFEAVPLPQLYLNLGPMGLDDRFRLQKYSYRKLEALFPDAKWPREILDQIKKKENRGSATVIRGFWRDYTDPEAPVWKAQVRVNDKEIGLDDEFEDEGECPLTVGRFNPVAGWAWGRGPGLRMLPSIRVLNELALMNLEGLSKTLDPAYVYPHDGILNLADGIEAGLGYPSMPGSAESIKELGLAGNLDYGYFSEERLIELLREGFYRSTMQRGKTPPSASQYIGDEQKDLRRIARPAAKLWGEFGVGLLKRLEFLERQPGGLLDGLDGPLLDSGAINVRPISPLERAQSREDVLVAQSLMQMARDAVGDQAAILIDGVATMNNVKTKLKDELVTFRTDKQIQEIMAMMQPQAAPNGQV